MNDSIATTAAAHAADGGETGLLSGWARELLRRRLARLPRGRLRLIEAAQATTFGKAAGEVPLEAEVRVRDPRFYRDLLLGGSVGAGESWMQGRWHSDDLTSVVRLMLRNRDDLDDLDDGPARLVQPLRALWHAWQRNTRTGAQRNIAAHYDLGNEFYALMLDETMMYSSAIFTHEQQSLYDAQRSRLAGICRKLELKESDHLLEIGTGWGGLALYAAKHFGCRVTTTTISQQQHAYAQERIARAGLADRVTVLLEDYRDLKGRFDKLVSIEMIEAVGHQYFDTYFRQCGTLLRSSGTMLLQAITIPDQRYQQARRGVDFIKRYIFPGGCLPSVTVMLDAMTRQSNLRLTHLEDIGPHYAVTLRRWRDNLRGNLTAVRALGYGESFLRMWEFYLGYCEAAFLERAISNVQMVLVKPGRATSMPLGVGPLQRAR
jgi:cyclopropane-fatty-acyl-phospholipid synthase